MTRTCRLAGVVVTVFLVGGWLLGDDVKKDAPIVKGKIPTGWSKLGLSDQQKQKITAISSKYRTEIDALKRQIKDLEKKEGDECYAVLTEAQKARLKEILAEKVPGGAKDAAKDAAKPAADKKPATDKP